MSTSVQAQRATVLLAASDPAERAGLARLLAEGGLGVAEAAAAAEALRRATAERPQLILLGESLRDVAPDEVGRALRADPATAAIPVLALSGGADLNGTEGQPVAPPQSGELVALVRGLLRLHRVGEALRQSEERYRALFEHNPQPMFVYDCETLGYLAVNDAAVQQYGYSREEFLRMTLADLRPPEDVPALLEMVCSREPRFERRGVWRHRKKDGTLIDVDILAHCLPFGDRPACIVLAHDVTERRRLEEQFLQAQKMEAVGRLAGGVAHDFNNLLTVINGYAEMLGQDLADNEPALAYARAIRKAGERAASLTQQLLTFGRKQIVAARVLDLNAIVSDAASLLRRLIGEDVLLSLELQPGLGRVRADPTQLEQVLLNLAVNARDAMPRGGRLVLATGDVELAARASEVRPGAYVVLSVADTGHGMTEEVRRHLFEPFFTTKEVGKGSGLGLSTVYGIVKQAGGHIDVESQPGAGSTFRVYLPRVAEPAPVPPHRPESAPAGGTVLLAEDEDAVRALAREVLRSEGYTVLEAADGDAALRLARGHGGRIDLLVTDVVMPGLGGRQLAEGLLALTPAVRVLYLSGYTEDAVVREGVSCEEVHFLPKPFSPAALAQKVREVLTTGP
jgi:PAS domain S-box-containing protein